MLGSLSLPCKTRQEFCVCHLVLSKPIVIFLCFSLISCADDEIIKVETWRLESFESELSCFVITDSPEADNIIIETLLGLDDSEYVETVLRLADNGEFQIVKAGQVVLVGNWEAQQWDSLRLMTKNQEWLLDVKVKHADSLVLKFNNNYKYLNNLQMTLRHKHQD